MARYIKPDNLPPSVSPLGPIITYVALDYIGAPLWITSIIVFLSAALLATAIYVRFKGEPIDVLNQKVRP